jgi:hypothetical protein
MQHQCLWRVGQHVQAEYNESWHDVDIVEVKEVAGMDFFVVTERKKAGSSSWSVTQDEIRAVPTKKYAASTAPKLSVESNARESLDVGKTVEISDTAEDGSQIWYGGTLYLCYGHIRGSVWLVKYDAVDGIQDGAETEEVVVFKTDGKCKILLEQEDGSAQSQKERWRYKAGVRKKKLQNLENVINLETNGYKRFRADTEKYSEKLESLNHWLHICSRIEDEIPVLQEANEAHFLASHATCSHKVHKRQKFVIFQQSVESMVADSTYFRKVLGARFHMETIFKKYIPQLTDLHKQAENLRSMVEVHLQNTIVFREMKTHTYPTNVRKDGGFYQPLAEEIGVLAPPEPLARSELSQLGRVKDILDSSPVPQNDLKTILDYRISSLRWILKLHKSGLISSGDADGAEVSGVEGLPCYRKLVQFEDESRHFSSGPLVSQAGGSVSSFPQQLCTRLSGRLSAAHVWRDEALKIVSSGLSVSTRQQQHNPAPPPLSSATSVALWGADAILHALPAAEMLPTLNEAMELYSRGLKLSLDMEEMSMLEIIVDRGQNAERMADAALNASLQQNFDHISSDTTAAAGGETSLGGVGSVTTVLGSTSTPVPDTSESSGTEQQASVVFDVSKLEKLKRQYDDVNRLCAVLQMRTGPNSQKVQMLLSHVTWTVKVAKLQKSKDMLGWLPTFPNSFFLPPFFRNFPSFTFVSFSPFPSFLPSFLPVGLSAFSTSSPPISLTHSIRPSFPSRSRRD